MKDFKLEEFVLGGVAACGAGFFSNPLEVVKIRMQLQGELKARGHYTVHYRNVFHAFYTVAKNDGILALQKGLVPALWYQFFMNGIRLGSYQTFINAGMTKKADGSGVSVPKSILAGATAGVIGAFFASPYSLLKTQLQSKSAETIAVGHQHQHQSFTQGVMHVIKKEGILGLWRGAPAAMVRVTMGSAAQLTTFSKTKAYVEHLKLFKHDSALNALLASMLSGVVVVAVMTPFDVISTRLYNQGVGSGGRGLFYSGFRDCLVKIAQQEGLWGFYKGWAASLFRLGPHTVLSLVFWNELRKVYKGLQMH